MEKLEVFVVVEAGLDSPREILKDAVENSVDDTDLETTENGGLQELSDLDGHFRDPDEPYHKVVKITIEEITTIEDAIADRASE